MSNSIWHERSKIVIWDTLKEYDITFTTDCSKFPEQKKKQIILSVQKAYPFGARENHPYKMWLNAVDEILGEILGIKRLKVSKLRKPKFKSKPKPKPVNENQLSLF